MISLDIGMTTKFCTALGHGAPAVSNKGGLLELYTHEWERIFVDPLPSGKQRERMVSLFTGHLRDLDASAWYLSDEWITNVITRIGTSHAPVWANASLLGVVHDAHKGVDIDDDVENLRKMQQNSPTICPHNLRMLQRKYRRSRKTTQMKYRRSSCKNGR